jgi:hypothetical protein
MLLSVRCVVWIPGEKLRVSMLAELRWSWSRDLVLDDALTAIAMAMAMVMAMAMAMRRINHSLPSA